MGTSIDAARFGRSLARLRRFQNVATTEEFSGATPDTVDFRDIGMVGTAITIGSGGDGAPQQAGETWFGGINKTSGGSLVLNFSSLVQLSGSWVSTLTFTGAGSWAYLIAITYNDNPRWVVLASNGVT